MEWFICNDFKIDSVFQSGYFNDIKINKHIEKIIYTPFEIFYTKTLL